MVTISTVLNRLPGTGINEHGLHIGSAFFAVQIPVMLGSGIWQSARASILSHATKCLPGFLDQSALWLEEPDRDLDLRVGVMKK